MPVLTRLERLSAALADADPAGLTGHGAPPDEYLPEAALLLAAAVAGTLTGEGVRACFAEMFAGTLPERPASFWDRVADCCRAAVRE